MRLGGYRTEVRRGLTWGVATDAAARASVMRLIFFFFFSFSDSRQLMLNRADSHRFGLNRIVSAKYRCVLIRDSR